jgi:hypothetical protein
VTIVDTYVDALGHSYVMDDKTVWMTVHGTTYAVTLEQARECWRVSARFTRLQPTAAGVQRARRALRGW